MLTAAVRCKRTPGAVVSAVLVVEVAVMSDTRRVEPVLWLVAPLLVTALVAVFLLSKNWRRAQSKEDLQKQQLQKMEAVLRQPRLDEASSGQTSQSKGGQS